MNRTLRKTLVHAGFAALSALQVRRWVPRVLPWQGAILMFHRVRPASADGFQPNRHLEVTPDYLDYTLSRLRRDDVAIVSMDEAVDQLARGVQGRFAAITFDDGYADNREHAWPVLRRHGTPFTIYVASGLIDGTARAWWMTIEEVVRRNDVVSLEIDGRPMRFATRTKREKHAAVFALADRLCCVGEDIRSAFVDRLAAATGFDIRAMLAREMMTWADVRDMLADPLTTIGAHTVDHPSLASLGDADARREMAAGRDRIAETTGVRPQHFAYPFGRRRDVSCRDVALAAELGFRSAVTTHPGVLRNVRPGSMHVLPRLSVNGLYQTAGHLDVLLSGAPFLLTDLRRGPPGPRLAPPEMALALDSR